MQKPGRTDSASRTIKAPPQTIYAAFVDAAALAAWLPPSGMTADIHEFDPREGGAFRITLRYDEPGHATPGKSGEHEDVVAGRFVELVPDRRIAWATEFQSDDPAFPCEMRMVWSLEPIGDGTRVTVVCENVPEGIRKQDHDAGLKSTLANLAAFTE